VSGLYDGHMSKRLAGLPDRKLTAEEQEALRRFEESDQAKAGCDLVMFHRGPDDPGYDKARVVVTQRCDDRKLVDATRCRMGGKTWKSIIRKNMDRGIKPPCAFVPARLIPCAPKEKPKKPPGNRSGRGPRFEGCERFDVRVNGVRVETVADFDEAQRRAQLWLSEDQRPTKGDDVVRMVSHLQRGQRTSWVSPACQSSRVIWRAK